MSDITIGRLRGGFCVYWYGPDGKRKRYQLEARTPKEAEAEARDVYRRHNWKPTGDTVATIWEAYRSDLGDRPTADTMGYTGKAILPEFGAFRPDQITRQMCKDYAAQRMKDGKSQGTVHTELGHLRSALVFALGNKAPQIWRPSKPDSSVKVLSQGEARSLIDHCSAPHVRLAVVLLLGTAARVGAVLDLTWDRVDFDRGIINLRLPDSATRKGRAIVPMNPMTRAALSAAAPAALSDFVVEHAGGPVKSIRKGVTNAMDRAGIRGVRIHDLRHTAAVTMLGEGVPIEQVGQILGHSNLATTYRIYGRFQPDHMQDAVNVLNFAGIRKTGA